MIQLTAFCTRGGGRSVNAYDAASNGNFDEDQPCRYLALRVGRETEKSFPHTPNGRYFVVKGGYGGYPNRHFPNVSGNGWSLI